jgi:hypothetical protein
MVVWEYVAGVDRLDLTRNVKVYGNTILGDLTSNTITFTGRVNSNILFSTDNTNDIGASGSNRPRDIFVARNLTVGSTSSSRVNVTGSVFVSGAVYASDFILAPGGTIGGDVPFATNAESASWASSSLSSSYSLTASYVKSLENLDVSSLKPSASLGNIFYRTSISNINASTTHSIIDTGLNVTQLLNYGTGSSYGGPVAYDVYISANPNPAGSSAYRHLVHGILYLYTNYNGTVVTDYLVFNEIFKSTDNNAIIEPNWSASVFLVNGGTEQVSSSVDQRSNWQLRARLSGFSPGTNTSNWLEQMQIVRRY